MRKFVINHVANVKLFNFRALMTSLVNMCFCRRPLQNNPEKKMPQYPCIFVLYYVRIEITFLTGKLSLINTCVVGLRRRALIFRDLPSNNMCYQR